jgi:hypothetical protein
MNVPWKVILAFIGIFIAGSVFGGFFAVGIGQQYAQRERQRPIAIKLPQQQFGAPQATQLLRRFAERLDLTEAQREKLKPIVSRAEEEIGRVRQKALEETDTILRRVQQDFRAELNADQKRKLDRMQKAQNDVMKQERQKRNLQDQQGMRPLQPGQPGPGPQNGQSQPSFNPNQPNPQKRPFQPQRPRNQGPQNPAPQNPPPQDDYRPPANQPDGTPPPVSP